MNTLIVSTFDCSFEDFDKFLADFHEKEGHRYLVRTTWSTKYVEAKGTRSNGWGVYVTYTEVDAAKSKPIDLFIVNKIQISDEENEYKCFGGEKKILSPWKPNSSKSTLKPIEYFFTSDT